MAELFFGEFRFDTRRLVLEGPEGPVEVRAKTLEVLTYLIAHRNRFVGRDELMRELWPDVHVTKASVTQCISELRRTLDDSARSPRYIETRVKYGYRFVATLYHKPTEHLETLPPPPELAGDTPPPPDSRHRPILLIAVMALLGVLTAVGIHLGARHTVRGPTAVHVVSVATADSGKTAGQLAEAIRTELIQDIDKDPSLSVAPRKALVGPELETEVAVRETASGRLEVVAVLRPRTDGRELWGWTWIVPAEVGLADTTVERIAERIVTALRQNRS
ncbi:MAG: hypothetical protein GXP47_14685 [Acidobacteria bacterium]|nr:hypothetical protein [Acidobacteriota bacterium]